MKILVTKLDRVIAKATDYSCSLLLLIIVIVVLYNVMMRYVFDAPPFWTDRISTFANMGMILLGLSLSVRGRDLIAMQALYEKISPIFAISLDAGWNLIILIFSIMFVWFGTEAAINMPGQYWDFQDFCIDLGTPSDSSGTLVSFFKLFESVVGMAIRPFCVDGAVPQKYMAMLMPVSGLLLVIASSGILIEDYKKINTMLRENGNSKIKEVE